MRNIVDIGKQGAEHVDVAIPTAQVELDGRAPFLHVIGGFPVQKIPTAVEDGTPRISADVEVHSLLLQDRRDPTDRRVFDLVWHFALYEPMVYASKAGRPAVMGMLSPNFDSEGKVRQPSIKVLPLLQPYPLIKRGKADFAPDENMATMLAGSAHSEGEGSGGHDKPVEEDYEHRLTIVGAASLGKDTILNEEGEHVQHGERQENGSVAASLTDGKLGNLFVPDGDQTGGFTGYAPPLVFEWGQLTPQDAIFFPKSFLGRDQAYGAHYEEGARIVYGAGVQIMYARLGQQAVSARLQKIASEVMSHGG